MSLELDVEIRGKEGLRRVSCFQGESETKSARPKNQLPQISVVVLGVRETKVGDHRHFQMVIRKARYLVRGGLGYHQTRDFLAI